MARISIARPSRPFVLTRAPFTPGLDDGHATTAFLRAARARHAGVRRIDRALASSPWHLQGSQQDRTQRRRHPAAT